MGNKLKNPVMASTIAGWCGAVLEGQDMQVSCIASFAAPVDGALCFANTAPEQACTTEISLISTVDAKEKAPCLLFTERPRLTFAKAVNAIQKNIGFLKKRATTQIDETAQVSSLAFVEPGAVIGARTVVLPFAFIGEGVVIGSDCIIKSGAVIGQDGFGFERDENDIPMRIAHLGGVIIGNNVEIGALNTICRGTLEDTVIEDHVKMDDHVHVAHNCRIRRGALLTACAELSGGVDVGEFSWVGPNASVMQKISIGKNSFVGIAANVTKNIPDNVVAAGNPAKILRLNK
jgi:UDP-3-O-[3-hydroxymyristoyl] glucosamine N-acyltransferase